MTTRSRQAAPAGRRKYPVPGGSYTRINSFSTFPCDRTHFRFRKCTFESRKLSSVSVPLGILHIGNVDGAFQTRTS